MLSRIWRQGRVSQKILIHLRVLESISSQVKFWITLNEPHVTATNGYEYGGNAPGVVDPGKACYVVGHNQIRAHARAYRLYYDEFAEQNGNSSTILPCSNED